jgi:hypothetical protein
MPTAAALAAFQIRLNMAEMTKLDGQIYRMDKQGVPHDSHQYKRAAKRLAIVTEASRGWRRRYFGLTGTKWLHYDMPKWDIAAEYRKENAAKNKAAFQRTKRSMQKQMVFAYSERIRECDQALALLISNVNSAKNPLLQIPKNATGSQVVAKGVEEIGFGFTENFMILERMIPWDIETNLVPQIKSRLRAAKAAFQVEKTTGRFQRTHRYLMQAATLINQGMAAMAKYAKAVQRSGKIAIAYIKWTAIVFTGAATSAYGGVQGVQAIGVAMTQKTGEEGITLAARWAAGEKITKKDVKKAFGEISLAGISTGVGEIASSFAGPVAAKLYRSPSPQQVAGVADALKGVIANNTEQAFKAIDNWMNGKPVNWDWWASLVAPAVGGELGAAVKDKDIREPVLSQ